MSAEVKNSVVTDRDKSIAITCKKNESEPSWNWFCFKFEGYQMNLSEAEICHWYQQCICSGHFPATMASDVDETVMSIRELSETLDGLLKYARDSVKGM